MVASPILGAGALLAVAIVNPRALPVALPLALIWIAAPYFAFLLSHAVPVRREVLDAADREFLLEVARKTWRYFDTFIGPADHSLPPDNVQTTPDLRVAHRTSPTDIAMALLATVSAHDLEFIDIDDMVDRLDATLTTVEGLERYEGHLLNWYDTRTLAPLCPAYVSTVDSGNLAGALITLASALPRMASADSVSAHTAERLHDLAARAEALFGAMNFKPLYDARRQLFAVGYRLADAEAAGRLDVSRYDLLASESRLASFLAICKGDVPESHWFHLGRAVTAVRGAPVLLSWSATLFEYVMPLLLMRTYAGTLLDESCRIADSTPDRLRRTARSAVGHFRVRLQRRRSPRHVPIQSLRRPRTGHEAWPW